MNIPLKYNARSLFVRRGTTLMTIASIALVVLVYIGVLALAAGLRQAFGKSGDPRHVIVLRDGARSETESYFAMDRHREIAALPGIERDAQGVTLASGEILILQILKRANGSESNVALRGVGPEAFAVRPRLRIVSGTNFRPGAGEVIVGTRLASRFPELRLGSTVTFGRLQFHVVGLFDAAGGSITSEVWGAREDLGSAFRRENYCSSTLLQAASPQHARELMAQIASDQRLHLQPMLEPDYYRTQTQATGRQFVIMGNALAILMGFGACFAAANTMYASVSARAAEIGTLRALGFRRRSILGAFITEAALLGLLAGALGAALALPLNSITTGTTNFLTFSEVSFSLRTTPDVLAGGILLAVFTAVIGGFAPAWSAARRPIAMLLREA